MGDDITIGVTEITNLIEVTSQPNDQIIDIGVTDNTDNVTVNVTPSVIEINIIKGTGSGSSAVTSVNGYIGDVVLTKTDLGLGNVDNTSDLDKPISTATQSALDLKVPYTGATSNVNLGEFQLSTGQITFDQTPTQSQGVAILRWNDTDGTLDLGLKGGNVTLQLGQEQVVRIVNKTASNLTEAGYQAVYTSGAQGQRLKVDLALANSDLTSAGTLGIVTENIAVNQEGFVTTNGLVRNINTTGSLQGETWIDGDILYLSPNIAGRITNIKPIAPQHLVVIGVCVYAHITQGSIFVKVDNGYELEELHNVLITSIANNEGLFYETSTGLWKNKSISTVLGYTPVSNALTISTTSPLNGGGDLSANRTLSISQSNTTTNGYLSSTDWNTFNNKQSALSGTGIVKSTAGVISYLTDNSTNWDSAYTNRITSLTTTGSSGASTLISNVLNIPTYTLSGLGGQASSTNLTSLSGLTFASTSFVKMTAAGTFTLDTNIYALDNGVVHLTGNETIAGLKTFANTGTGVINGLSLTNSSTNSSVGVINIDNTSSGIAYRASISSSGPAFVADGISTSSGFLFAGRNLGVNTFTVNKLGNVTGVSFIKTGGLSTEYLKADGSVSTLTNPITGTGTTNYLPKFTGTSALGNSIIYDNGTNIGIGTTSPVNNLHIQNGYSANTIAMIQSWGTESAGEHAGIRFKSAGTASDEYGKGFIGFRNNGTGYGRGDLYFSLNNSTDASNAGLTDSKMVITSGGNVLIGTTTDIDGVTKLQVNGSAKISGDVTANVLRSNYEPNNYIDLYGTTSDMTFNSQYGYPNGGFKFKHAGLTQFSINANNTATFASLSGTGTRTVVADASGNLSASATSNPAYKVYTALLTQSGTSAPTAVVLENTLGGTVVLSRVSAGQYKATLTGAFTTNKTTSSCTTGAGTGNNIVTIAAYQSTANEVVFNTSTVAGGGFIDGVLSAATFEVRVYN